MMHRVNKSGKPRKKYVKPTQREKEARVAEAAMLTAHGATRIQCHRIMCPKYDVHWATVDRYLLYARQLSLERAKKTKPDAIAEAISFYDKIILDPKSTRKEQFDARERLDKIFGVYAANSIRIGDPNGKPLAPAVVAPIVNFNFPGNQRNGALHNGNGTADNKLRTAAGKAD